MNETRQRIVTAAAESFRRCGYNGTSLKDITSAADATTGSLYHFWSGGKEELTAEVLATSGAVYREFFQVSVVDTDDPGQAIADFFVGGAVVLESTDFIDPCPIGGVAREVASTNETLRSAADGVFAGWVEAATTYFERCGLGAEVAHDLATTIIATIEGGFVMARTSRDASLFVRLGRQMQMLVDATMAAAATSGHD